MAVGVSYEDHPTERVPILYCLGEVEENDISKLIKESIRLGREYMVSSWYGDTEGLLRESLYPINKGQREMGQPEFRLISAPNIRHPDHFGYHARLIGENLKAGEKLLFLGNCSKLKGYLSEFSKEAAIKGSSEEYPAVAALGCVVASMRTYKPWEYYGYKDPGPIPPLDPIAGY